MDFQRAIDEVCGQLDQAGLHYALIGGFAMAMRGVQRATVDLDFLLLLEDLEKADEILQATGYNRYYHSDNISHYRSEAPGTGRIDLLHAFRGPSIGMLDRAERLAITPERTVPVLQSEDIIGLKIQATVNDPQRETQDWLDIRLLLQSAAHNGLAIDWHLIEDYLDIFKMSERLSELKHWYGQTD